MASRQGGYGVRPQYGHRAVQNDDIHFAIVVSIDPDRQLLDPEAARVFLQTNNRSAKATARLGSSAASLGNISLCTLDPDLGIETDLNSSKSIELSWSLHPLPEFEKLIRGIQIPAQLNS